ncbi:MAG: hypothetical protein ABJF23_13080 [Bryobacteraceae bacterium]
MTTHGQALTSHFHGIALRLGTAGPALTWWSRMLPMIVIQAYLALSVVAFAFGPWDYPPVNSALLFSFVGVAHVCLLLGYLSAAFKVPACYGWRLQPARLALVSVVITLLLAFPTSYLRTGHLFPDVLNGISNPGQAYNRAYTFRLEASPVAEYFRIAGGPFIGLCLPLLVAYWKSLGYTLRILGVATVGLNLSLYVATGTNKALADAFLIIPAILLVRHFAGDFKMKWINKAIAAVAVLVSGFLLFQFFSSGMGSRGGSSVAHGYIPSVGARVNYSHPVLNLDDEGLRTGILGVALYTSGGYYGLAMALEEPFVPMFGVGNSRFLTRQAARLLDDASILYRSYPDRVQQQTGWNANGLWATIYPWIASDVSFPGVFVIVFLVGRIFAQSWLDSLTLRNPFAIAMYAQLVIMLFYFNANNQCLQDGEGVSTFLVILILWRYSRTSGYPEIAAITSGAA